MATENPYTAPSAQIADPTLEVPDDIRKKIRNALVAAFISGSITLVVTLIAMSGTDILGFSAWELFDVALIFLLAFGIYKKSRVCAVAMLTYFVLSKIFIMVESGRPPGIPLAIVFIYFYWQGVSGTFAYHKLRSRKPVLVASGG